MAKSLNATLKSSVYYKHTNTDALGVVLPDTSTLSVQIDLTPGTGANGTADQKYANQYTIAGAGTQDIDLAGSLVDGYGATITFARIKSIFVQVLGTADDPASTGGPVDVGGATTPFINWISAGTAKVRVGGTAGRKAFLHLGCDDAVAYAVTPATADLLRLTNVHASNPVKVKVVLIGSSI